LARYASMLAMVPAKTLGEGDTPLIEISQGLYVKAEYLNPSGSFKDRGASLCVTHACMHGYSTIVEDTSGNTGIALSMYAARCGMRMRVVVPRDAPEGKVKLLRLLGAEVVFAEDRGSASRIARELASLGEYYASHLTNPLFIEGPRTIAYEIYEQLGEIDNVVVPVGSGGLVLGIAYGFQDLLKLGLIRRIPRIVAVQRCDVAPLYRAIYGLKEPGGDAWLADGIRVPDPPRLNEIANVVKHSMGEVILVNNEDIVKALSELVEMGILVEPTAATAFAAYTKLRDKLAGSTVVVLTGSGSKMLSDLESILRRTPR